MSFLLQHAIYIDYFIRFSTRYFFKKSCRWLSSCKSKLWIILLKWKYFFDSQFFANIIPSNKKLFCWKKNWQMNSMNGYIWYYCGVIFTPLAIFISIYMYSNIFNFKKSAWKYCFEKSSCVKVVSTYWEDFNTLQIKNLKQSFI